MVAFAEHREVRVTERKSVRMPFVAPDVAPVSTLALELDKGLRGWTDWEEKCPDLRGDHLPRGHAKRELAAFNAGDRVIRKNRPARQPVKSRYVNQGPGAGRRALMAKLGK